MHCLPIDSVKDPYPNRDRRDVDCLAQSIATVGLINPITVDEAGRLIAGRHRLQACKNLGWNEIPAVVRHGDVDPELISLDENIVRRHIPRLARAKLLARRKEIYETEHPEAKRGAAGGRALANDREVDTTHDTPSLRPATAELAVRDVNPTEPDQTAKLAVRDVSPTEPDQSARFAVRDVSLGEVTDAAELERTKSVITTERKFAGQKLSYCAQAAGEMGLSERTVFEDIQIGKGIPDDVVSLISGTRIEDNRTELLELARLPADEQLYIAKWVAANNGSSIRDPLRSLREHQARQTANDPPRVRPVNPRDFLEAIPVYSADLLITRLPVLKKPFKPKMPDGYAVLWVGECTSKVKLSGRAFLILPSDPYSFDNYVRAIGEQFDLAVGNILALSSSGGSVSPCHYPFDIISVVHLIGFQADRLSFEDKSDRTSLLRGDLDTVAERLILSSTKPGDLVLDPFARDGKFLLAAWRIGRHGLGSIDDEHLLKTALEAGCVRDDSPQADA